MTRALARYDAACQAVAECKSVDEAKDIRDRAVAMAAYARQAKNKDLEADAAEIRTRAEIRLGEMIKAAKDAGQISEGRPKKLSNEDDSFRVTLEEAGISRDLSSRAQRLASLPNEQRERVVARMREAAAETTKAAKTVERELNNAEARSQAQPLPDGKYSVIYADPPWTFQVWSGEGKDRAAENHYPTMTQAEIEALPVAELAADDCALFMWAVMPQLPEALAVIEAWGFEYKTCAFVWVKRTKDEQRFATGMGYWTRANAEVCLLATRGSPQRLNADVHQVIESPRMEHSRKPEEAAVRIMRLIGGPYIELFARAKREGWEAWGNQA